jgi:hypothetical protein
LFLVVIETLMTPAFSRAASRIPWASVNGLPVSPFCTLIERIFAPGATPSNGTPALCMSLAAMMAAIAVP